MAVSSFRTDFRPKISGCADSFHIGVELLTVVFGKCYSLCKEHTDYICGRYHHRVLQDEVSSTNIQ